MSDSDDQGHASSRKQVKASRQAKGREAIGTAARLSPLARMFAESTAVSLPGTSTIYGDVIFALREAVTKNSGFTRATFTLDIVPNKPFPKGLGAQIGGWGLRLGIFEAELHKLNQAYRMFVVTEDDLDTTIGISLADTAEFFTDRIKTVLGLE